MASIRYRVVLERLYCRRTTESGHDEVYFILGGADAGGGKITVRGPDVNQGATADNYTAWDMNDSGVEQNRRLNAILYEGNLDTGQYTSLLFSFLESDGTNIGAQLQAAAAVAEKIFKDGSTGQIIAQIAGFLAGFIPTNQDDLLGAFSLELHNGQAGLVAETVKEGSYTSWAQWFNPADGRFTLRFQHDGGDYTAYFRVDGLTPPDGATLIEQSSPAVFVIFGGAKFWVPSPDVLNALYGGWGNVRTVPDGSLNALPTVPRDGTVLREQSAPEVYRIEQGKKRWITSPPVLERYGGWAVVRVIHDAALAGIPLGDPIW